MQKRIARASTSGAGQTIKPVIIFKGGGAPSFLVQIKHASWAESFSRAAKARNKKGLDVTRLAY
jgi:hypothetical protein